MHCTPNVETTLCSVTHGHYYARHLGLSLIRSQHGLTRAVGQYMLANVTQQCCMTDY